MQCFGIGLTIITIPLAYILSRQTTEEIRASEGRILGKLAEYYDGLPTTQNDSLRVLFQTGMIAIEFEDPAKAEEMLTAALHLDDITQRNRLALLMVLGNLRGSVGDTEGGSLRWREALGLSRATGDLIGEATALNNIGIAHWTCGNLDTAFHCCDESRAIYRRAGDRLGEAKAITNIAAIFHVRGDMEESLSAYHEALVIVEEEGKREEQSTILGNIAIVYSEQGYQDKAIDLYTEALAIAKETGNREEESRHLGNIGAAYHEQDALRQAMDYYLEALSIQQEIGFARGQVSTLNNIGAILRERREYEDASAAHEQAITISGENGYRLGEGIGYFNKGSVSWDQGKRKESSQYMRRARDIFREIHAARELEVTERALRLLWLSQHWVHIAFLLIGLAVASCSCLGIRRMARRWSTG